MYCIWCVHARGRACTVYGVYMQGGGHVLYMVCTCKGEGIYCIWCVHADQYIIEKRYSVPACIMHYINFYKLKLVSILLTFDLVELGLPSNSWHILCIRRIRNLTCWKIVIKYLVCFKLITVYM